MESWHENPKLAEIDIALSELDETIGEMAIQWDYKIERSGDGAFDIPHRWITRKAESSEWQIRYAWRILIGVPITVRLERGFYPDIPLNITAQAALQRFDPFSELMLGQSVVEGLRYSDASARLPDLFREIKSIHDEWDFDYISEHGETIEEFIARCKDEDDDKGSSSPS